MKKAMFREQQKEFLDISLNSIEVPIKKVIKTPTKKIKKIIDRIKKVKQ